MSEGKRLGATTIAGDPTLAGASLATTTEVLALVVLWCGAEPARAGEVALFGEQGRIQVLGRGELDGAGGDEPVRFERQRPGVSERQPPLAGPTISRRQLRVVRRGEMILVEVVGRCPVSMNGAPCREQTALSPGDTLLLKGELLLGCARRTLQMPALRHYPAAMAGPFGGADGVGLVGESPLAWAMRDDLAFAAQAHAGVLLLGGAGSGKALAARAVHALSPRASGPFVTCSAAALPASVLEAELFGNLANYPHAGAPERIGLLGEADGGTLFVDDLDELAGEIRTKLLTGLASSECRRLGESTVRRVDVRLVAAMAVPRDDVAPEIADRFALSIELPRLDARREDVPLLARHVLRAAAERSPGVVGRFTGDDGEARLDPALVAELFRRPYRAEVREIEAELWKAMRASAGPKIAPVARATVPANSAAPSVVANSPPPPTPPPVSVKRRIDLEREGDVWRFSAGGATVRVKDGKGVAYLDHLLRHPNEEFYCLDLVITIDVSEVGSGAGVLSKEGVRAADAGDAGPLLDKKAKDAYRRRLEDLEDQLEEANAHGDRGRAAGAQREIDAIGDELARAVGLGGRDRKAASAAERARINVQRRIRDAIQRIEEHDAALGKYLAAVIRTGTYCSFVPLEG